MEFEQLPLMLHSINSIVFDNKDVNIFLAVGMNNQNFDGDLSQGALTGQE